MSIELGTRSWVWKTPRIWCQCCDANSPWLPVPAPWQREGCGGRHMGGGGLPQVRPAASAPQEGLGEKRSSQS